MALRHEFLLFETFFGRKPFGGQSLYSVLGAEFFSRTFGVGVGIERTGVQNKFQRTNLGIFKFATKHEVWLLGKEN